MARHPFQTKPKPHRVSADLSSFAVAAYLLTIVRASHHYRNTSDSFGKSHNGQNHSFSAPYTKSKPRLADYDGSANRKRKAPQQTRVVSRRGEGEKSAEFGSRKTEGFPKPSFQKDSFFPNEPSLLLSGEFLVLLFRDKSTKKPYWQKFHI